MEPQRWYGQEGGEKQIICDHNIDITFAQNTNSSSQIMDVDATK